MSIISFTFILFMLPVCIFYYIFPAKYRWIELLAASTIFYISYGQSIYSILFFLAAAIVTWFFALKISISDSWEDKQLYLVIAVVIIVLMLFLCKYYSDMASKFNEVSGLRIWTAENIILPLGISYYSLQLIGYIVDVSRGIVRAQKNPLKVILYGIFFLSITQGPFNSYNDLTPMLYCEENRKPTMEQIWHSLLRIMGGYIKKLCIADQLARIVNTVYGDYINYSCVAVLFAMVCFAIQLYADFSGYMDIIIGFGGILGISMPENFRQPFFSTNIQEFWQRWHITLGAWLKDYVYYPILRSGILKNSKKRLSLLVGKDCAREITTWLGLFITWLLIGIWHGSGMNYVFGTGILQFMYILISRMTEPMSINIKKLLKIDESGGPLKVLRFFKISVLMIVAWVFFRADSMSMGIGILGRLFSRAGLTITDIFTEERVNGRFDMWLPYIIICTEVLLMQDYLHETGRNVHEIIMSKPFVVRALFYCGMFYALIIFGAYGPKFDADNFLYFGF